MPDDPSKPKTDAATTQPAASPPATTPTPATAVVEDPKPADATTSTAPSTSTTPATVTPEMLNAALESHPLVKHYRAQEAKEKAFLITALGKKQKVFTVEQLTAMSLDQIRPIAELAGVGIEMSAASAVVAGDYSGRMMASGTDTDDAEVEVPKPWSAALKARDRDKTAN